MQNACLSVSSQAAAVSPLGTELFFYTMPWRDRSWAIQGRKSHPPPHPVQAPREAARKGGRASVILWVCWF